MSSCLSANARYTKSVSIDWGSRIGLCWYHLFFLLPVGTVFITVIRWFGFTGLGGPICSYKHFEKYVRANSGV